MNIEELKQALAQPSVIQKQRFALLQSIAQLLNRQKESDAREMVLRATEHRQEFGEMEPILDALLREVGLFPYANPESLSLADTIAYEYHRPLNLEGSFVFHREQAEIYRRLMEGQNVILSAPTSFGKSRIIDAVIASGHYTNIAVIVPTIALIDETRRRLSSFSPSFKVVTQVSQEPGARNLFVFTAERANAYERFPPIDFVALDEFYKIGAMSEDKQRTVALNQAFYKLVKKGAQFYMLGPCVKEIPRGVEERYRCLFYPTSFATVVSEEVRVRHTSKNALSKLTDLCRSINEPTLIFCKSPKRVNEVARALFDGGIGASSGLSKAADWLARHFHPDWILPQALDQGIGIHHGRLPRSIGQFVVRAFNDEKLRFLICTSTLIEGVNTKAKNVVIFDKEIAQEEYDYFTFNNIKGRSGRMFEHFIGRVYLFHPPPQEMLPFVDFPLFTQGKQTPDSILIQLDEDDLSIEARTRVEPLKQQDKLPFELLRQNSAIEPEDLLQLSEAIAALTPAEARNLSWRRYPDYSQLKYCCNLLWKHLVERAHAGVYSGNQLAYKINLLSKTPNVRERVTDELQPGQYAAKSADEAVERVLEFDRTWASFELPKLLKALSAVQRHVLGKKGQPVGDYSFFSNLAENLFRKPFQVPLEEYGLPLQITDKLIVHFRNVQSIDEAIDRLKALQVRRLQLEPFEEELLEDCRAYL